MTYPPLFLHDLLFIQLFLLIHWVQAMSRAMLLLVSHTQLLNTFCSCQCLIHQGSLPYAITSPSLTHFASRICASHNYGILAPNVLLVVWSERTLRSSSVT